MTYCVLIHTPHPSPFLSTTAIGPYDTAVEAQAVADEITTKYNPGYTNPAPEHTQWVNPALQPIVDANGIWARSSLTELDSSLDEVYTFIAPTIQYLSESAETTAFTD